MLLSRRRNAAPRPRQRLSQADPVHAAAVGREPAWTVRIDTGDRRDRSARPPLRARLDHRPQGPVAALPRRGDGVRRDDLHPPLPGGRMSENLDRLAAAVGIEASYFALNGETGARFRRRQARRAPGDGYCRRRRGPDRRFAHRHFPDRTRPARRARRRGLLLSRLAEEWPHLGHRVPALLASLATQLGYRRFRGSRPPRRDRRGGRRRFRRRQPAARAVPRRSGARQPVLPLQPRVPEPALHRGRQGAGLHRNGGCTCRPGGDPGFRVRRIRSRRNAEEKGADDPLPNFPGARRRARLRRISSASCWSAARRSTCMLFSKPYRRR